MATYPEHDKMAAVKDRAQAIGEFVDWLESKDMTLAAYERGGDLFPYNLPIERLLADFFGIDLKVIAAEKQAMLDEQRALNAAR